MGRARAPAYAGCSAAAGDQGATDITPVRASPHRRGSHARVQPPENTPYSIKSYSITGLYTRYSDRVRDHRVATRGRRRSWYLTSLAPRSFASGSHLISPL